MTALKKKEKYQVNHLQDSFSPCSESIMEKYPETFVRVMEKQLIKAAVTETNCVDYSIVVAITFLLILIEIWIGF